MQKNHKDHNQINVDHSFADHPSSREGHRANATDDPSNQDNIHLDLEDDLHPTLILKDSSYSEKLSCELTCASVLFIILTATIGIIIVCITSPKETNDTCQLTFKRSIKPIYTNDSRPRHAAIGDFNQDNNQDFVVAYAGTDSIGILLGYGNGSFAPSIIYKTDVGSSPYWVAVEDVNNDTHLDIAVANYGAHNIGIFLGNGNGSFANQLTFSLGSSRPVSLAMGDFNGDNLWDIAVVNNGTFFLIILLGFGNGQFQIATTYPLGYDTMPYSLAVADFNNDHQHDIVTVNYGTSEIAVFLAIGNFTFSINRYSTGSGSQPASIVTGHFDNDDSIDIAVANSANSSIGVFLGNGNGTFPSITTYSVGSSSHPKFLVVDDFNDDKKIDMVIANSEADNIFILDGYENNRFITNATLLTGYNSYPYSMAVGDFDNDDKPDIVVVNNGNNYILVFTSYAFHITANQTTYPVDDGFYPSAIAVGDLNNDKKLDFVVSNEIYGDVGVFMGIGDGTFTSEQLSLSDDDDGFYFIVLQDFNNDNYSDIAVDMYFLGEVFIYLGQGNGSFNDGGVCLLEDYTYPTAIATADFNNDGNFDIVTSDSGTNDMGVFLGYGNGSFEDAVYYSTGDYSSPELVRTGDFNGDNSSDFISANYGSNTIGIHLNKGDGTFANQTNVSTDFLTLNFLVVGDLNNDDRLDIVFIDSDYPFIAVFIGNGNGTFKDWEVYYVEDEVSPVATVISDFNKDKIMDIAVLDVNNPVIYFLFGQEDGTFSTENKIDIEDVSYSFYMAIGDFNKDGESDLVTGNVGSDDLSVLILRYQASFVNKTSYLQESGSHPTSLTTGDFDNNNQVDIVVANSGNDNVQILFDYKDGSFMKNISYSTDVSSHPKYVLAADFNKDKQLDLIVANSGTDSLAVFLSSNNGTFAAPIVYLTGPRSAPNSIDTGDFNNDGWMDVAVANIGANNIGVFLGFDYPTFQISNINISKSRWVPDYVVTRDFNNDSQLDLVVACRQENSIAVLLGYGNGTFSNATSYYVEGYTPVSLVVGDFNNDNRSDIAVANSGDSSVSIMLGNGDATFNRSDESLLTEDASPVFIAVGDFNKDHVQDIVVANQKSDIVGLFIGYGNGSFENQTSYKMPNGSSPAWIAVSDFDNDNISDIAVANYGGNTISILLEYHNGSFRNTTYSTGNNSRPCALATGDFNKDNFIDIAVANRLSQNVMIFIGSGNGTFSLKASYTIYSSSSLLSIEVADLNNDTILDIVISDAGVGNSFIGVLYGLGSGNFLVLKAYSTESNSQPSSVVIADFDNDGRVDLAYTNSKKNNIGIMLRNKSEPFGLQTPLSTGNTSSPSSVVVYDFNNDNQLDIAVINSNTSTLGIFLGLGNGSFEKQVNYSTGQSSNPISIAVGDINNDNRIDIIVANFNTSNIGIFLGNGNGTFGIIQTYTTGQGSSPSHIAVADLNKDNQLDIVVANTGVNSVLVFFGHNNGTYSNFNSYSLAYNSRPIAVAIGDYNNDTWLDIAVANDGLGYVEVFLQTC